MELNQAPFCTCIVTKLLVLKKIKIKKYQKQQLSFYLIVIWQRWRLAHMRKDEDTIILILLDSSCYFNISYVLFPFAEICTFYPHKHKIQWSDNIDSHK